MKLFKLIGGKANIMENLHEKFKLELNLILQNMPYRSFPLLRSRILEILPKYKKDGGRQNNCSKHWWFNFMNNHPEVKEKWESIPLQRTVESREKGKNRKNESPITTASEGHSFLESPTDFSYRNLDVQQDIFAEINWDECPSLKFTNSIRSNYGLGAMVLNEEASFKEKMDEENDGNSSPSRFFA